MTINKIVEFEDEELEIYFRAYCTAEISQESNPFGKESEHYRGEDDGVLIEDFEIRGLEINLFGNEFEKSHPTQLTEQEKQTIREQFEEQLLS